MADKWLSSYGQLKEFIALHSNIKITPKLVIISSDIRSEFYQFFDAVRSEFIKGYFTVELEKSYALSQHWKSAGESLVEDTQLEDINMEAGVKWFLSDPVDGLIRELYNPLFDLLKNLIDIEGFKQKAIKIISKYSERYYKRGYELWAIMSLIKLLDVTKVYTVMPEDAQTDPTIVEVDSDAGQVEAYVPRVEETKKIIFENVENCSFLTPRIIIQSKLLNRFIALRPGFYKAHWKALFLSENQEWFKIKNIYKDFGDRDLWPDLAIYVSYDLADLGLVADYHNIARPDVIIDINEQDDWFQGNSLASIKRHYDILKPKLGAFIVSRTPIPQSLVGELKSQPQLHDSTTTQSTIDTEKLPLEQSISGDDYAYGQEKDSSGQNTEVILQNTSPVYNINLIGTEFDANRLKIIVDMLSENVHPQRT